MLHWCSSSVTEWVQFTECYVSMYGYWNIVSHANSTEVLNKRIKWYNYSLSPLWRDYCFVLIEAQFVSFIRQPTMYCDVLIINY